MAGKFRNLYWCGLSCNVYICKGMWQENLEIYIGVGRCKTSAKIGGARPN